VRARCSDAGGTRGDSGREAGLFASGGGGKFINVSRQCAPSFPLNSASRYSRAASN
jgi:hypothetical protein